MSGIEIPRLRELFEEGLTDSAIGAALGVSADSVFRARKRYGIGYVPTRPGVRPGVAVRDDGTSRLYPMRVGKPNLTVDLDALRADLLAEIRGLAPKLVFAKLGKPQSGGGLLHVVSPVDLHVGKLAWAPETGEDYDSGIAEARLHTAVERLLGLAERFPVREQLLVVGNDLLQVDNLLSMTTAGTTVDTDSRYKKMFRVAVRVMAETIRRMREVGPVKVVVVPGNHDTLATFHVGEVLAALFHGIEGIAFDLSLRPRLYHRHGACLLGFTHGNEEKHSDLPLVMAQENPEAWSKTRYREFLVGHFHKRKQTQFVAGDSFNGVRVSVLPSLSGTDAWHAKKGYVGEPKASESRLYDRTEGLVATFHATVKE